MLHIGRAIDGVNAVCGEDVTGGRRDGSTIGCVLVTVGTANCSCRCCRQDDSAPKPATTSMPLAGRQQHRGAPLDHAGTPHRSRDNGWVDTR